MPPRKHHKTPTSFEHSKAEPSKAERKPSTANRAQQHSRLGAGSAACSPPGRGHMAALPNKQGIEWMRSSDGTHLTLRPRGSPCPRCCHPEPPAQPRPARALNPRSPQHPAQPPQGAPSRRPSHARCPAVAAAAGRSPRPLPPPRRPPPAARGRRGTSRGRARPGPARTPRAAPPPSPPRPPSASEGSKGGGTVDGRVQLGGVASSEGRGRRIPCPPPLRARDGRCFVGVLMVMPRPPRRSGDDARARRAGPGMR